jgi:hypothetical protein
MARVKVRGRREVLERCQALRAALGDAVEDGGTDADALWAGEALGMLLWALELAQLPPYDRPFDPEPLLRVDLDGAELRPDDELARAREIARLWHWRARTAELQAEPDVPLPQQWQSFDQLVGATAMRGYEQGLLPRPLRGDFPAFGTVYRDLSDEQRAEAHNIAWERHRALNWLCGLGKRWDETPTDT